MLVKILLCGLLYRSTFAFHSTPSVSIHSVVRRSSSCRPTLGSAKGSHEESTSENGGKVIIVGSINQDLTTYAPSLPTPGQTIVGSGFSKSAGGKGGNQAAAASSIGVVSKAHGVHMIGRVGNDDMGQSLVSSLQSLGVKIDETESTVEGANTGVASIVIDTITGQNTIVVTLGANLLLTEEEVKSSLGELLGNSESKGKGRDVVLMQLEITPESTLQSLKSASKLGALTILNPAPAPEGWALDNEWLSSIDILIPNETELVSLCGDITGVSEEDMAKSLLEKGVRTAVICTLGSRGAMIVDHLKTTMIAAPSELPCNSLPVVSTAGAGDSFCGALSAYLSRGVELEQAAIMACGVASMSVRKKGAQESYPKEEEMPDVLRLDSIVYDETVSVDESDEDY